MLSAIATVENEIRNVTRGLEKLEKGKDIPLWEGLVAANMALLARLTTISRLGMALARRTTARTGHSE